MAFTSALSIRAWLKLGGLCPTGVTTTLRLDAETRAALSVS
jgi:hypothetical protein